MGHLDRADLFHAFFARFLFFKQLLLARNIAAVTLGDDVFAQGFDCLTRDHVGANGRLDGNVELLARNNLTHFGHHGAATIDRLAPVNNDRQRIDALTVEQDIDLDNVGCTELFELVVLSLSKKSSTISPSGMSYVSMTCLPW